MERPVINPYLAIVVGAIAISSAAVLVKLSSAPAGVIAAYRLLFTIALMAPMFLFAKKTVENRLGQKEWILSLLSGLFLALHFIFWFESLRFTSVASSVVLVTLQPLFTFLGAYYFFQEKLNKKAILGGIIAIGGSVIICWGDFRLGGTAIFGNFLALLGAIMVSAYWLFGQHLRQSMSLKTYTFVVYGASTFFLFIYVFLFGQSIFPYPGYDWLIFLGLAIFPTLLGHSIFNWVVKWVGASMVSMSILFEPIGASILAYFILGEVLQWSQWLGGLVILSGIFIFLHFKDKN